MPKRRESSECIWTCICGSKTDEEGDPPAALNVLSAVGKTKVSSDVRLIYYMSLTELRLVLLGILD